MIAIRCRKCGEAPLNGVLKLVEWEYLLCWACAAEFKARQLPHVLRYLASLARQVQAVKGKR